MRTAEGEGMTGLSAKEFQDSRRIASACKRFFGVSHLRMTAFDLSGLHPLEKQKYTHYF